MRSQVDVAVIGGGAAGLIAAAGCATLGARTVLIEQDRLGGECTWKGCVPSKALLHIASLAATTRTGNAFGIHTSTPTIDFGQVMASVRGSRRKIYEHGESPTYLKTLGIRPLQATARFVDPHSLEIERAGRRQTLTFRSAIVATGSRPFVPEIDGLNTSEFLTTDTLFELDRLPERLVIFGGGAVGVEIAQAFARLGSRVTIVTRDGQLLPGVDRDAAHILQRQLEEEGVTIHLRSTISCVARQEQLLCIDLSGEHEPGQIFGDQLLIATGRTANFEDLDLPAAGVEFDRHGIIVDDYCRTSANHIFATGDVTPAENLTHVAENMSKAAAINALARFSVWKRDTDVIPSVVYTDPEVATVGLSADTLNQRGIRYDTIDLPYDMIDRAVIEDHTSGFVRVHHRFGKVLGVTIVGTQAGEIITEYAIAMRHGLRLPAIAETIHPYPTMMLGARRAADQVFVRSIKPWMVRAFQHVYGYRGDIPEHVGSRTII